MHLPTKRWGHSVVAKWVNVARHWSTEGHASVHVDKHAEPVDNPGPSDGEDMSVLLLQIITLDKVEELKVTKPW